MAQRAFVMARRAKFAEPPVELAPPWQNAHGFPMLRPISVNQMYLRRRGAVIRSKTYQRWLANASNDIRFKAVKLPRIEGWYEIVLEAGYRRNADVDNLLKVTLDALHKHWNVTDDDRFCVSATARYCDLLPSTRAYVWLRPAPAPKGFLKSEDMRERALERARKRETRDASPCL